MIIRITYDFGYNKIPRYNSADTIRPETDIKTVLLRMVKGVLIIALIAGVIGFMTAQNSTSCSDSDPVYGGGSDCEVIEGTGGTIDTARTIFIFTVLATPFLLGCYQKIKDIKRGTVDRDYKNTMLLKSNYDKEINDSVDKHMKEFYKQEAESDKKKGNK